MANAQGKGRSKAPKSGDSTEDGTADPLAHMTRREAAEYIAGMLDELLAIANRAELSFVAYLLAMALQEARTERARED